jgi:5-methylcytosine-specific restriction protein B
MGPDGEWGCQVNEEAFKAWLEEGGAKSEAGRNTRAYAVRTIEN